MIAGKEKFKKYICGQAKIRSVHTYVIPWIHFIDLNRTVVYIFASANELKLML